MDIKTYTLSAIEAAQLLLAFHEKKKCEWKLIESRESEGCGFLAPHPVYEKYRTTVSTSRGPVQIFLEYSKDYIETYGGGYSDTTHARHS